MNTFKKFAVIAALALSVSASAVVSAQDDTVDPVCTDPEARLALIAEALDMTVEELEAAREEGITIRDLVEEQGIDLREILPDCPRPDREALRAERLTALAEAFGITVEELQDQLDAGVTIAQLAEQYGVELEDLRPDGAGRPPFGQGEGQPPVGEDGELPPFGQGEGQPPVGEDGELPPFGQGEGQPPFGQGRPGRGPRGG